MFLLQQRKKQKEVQRKNRYQVLLDLMRLSVFYYCIAVKKHAIHHIYPNKTKLVSLPCIILEGIGYYYSYWYFKSPFQRSIPLNLTFRLKFMGFLLYFRSDRILSSFCTFFYIVVIPCGLVK